MEKSSFQLEFLQETSIDIANAQEYYGEISKELAIRFTLKLRQTFDSLRDNPFSKSIRYSKVRLAHVNKFPYSVHFLVNKDDLKVTILGIFHQHQNPDKWRRLK